MKQWETHIADGNRHFSTSEFEDAETAYLRALARATKLHAIWFRADDAVSSIVISYVNLSHVYLKQRNIERSIATIEDGIHALIKVQIRPNISTLRYETITNGMKWLDNKQQYLQNIISSGQASGDCQCPRCQRDHNQSN